MTKITFKVKSEHIKLLKNMYVEWQDCETGAPAIDPKRPYGNSSVAADIHGILTGEKNRDLTENKEVEYLKLHTETEIALQILLNNLSIKPGIYETEEYSKDWKIRR